MHSTSNVEGDLCMRLLLVIVLNYWHQSKTTFTNDSSTVLVWLPSMHSRARWSYLLRKEPSVGSQSTVWPLMANTPYGSLSHTHKHTWVPRVSQKMAKQKGIKLRPGAKQRMIRVTCPLAEHSRACSHAGRSSCCNACAPLHLSLTHHLRAVIASSGFGHVLGHAFTSPAFTAHPAGPNKQTPRKNQAHHGRVTCPLPCVPTRCKLR